MVNKTKKFFILSASIFTVSIFCLSGVVFASVFFRNKLEVEKASLQSENDKIANLKEINNMLKETEEKRKFITSLFTDKESIIDFLGLLESVGEKAGSEVIVVSVFDDPKIGFAGSNRIKLQVKGTWSQVFKSLYLLDNIPMTFSVKNLSLSQQETDGNLKVRSFWQADIEALVLKSDNIKK